MHLSNTNLIIFLDGAPWVSLPTDCNGLRCGTTYPGHWNEKWIIENVSFAWLPFDILFHSIFVDDDS